MLTLIKIIWIRCFRLISLVACNSAGSLYSLNWHSKSSWRKAELAEVEAAFRAGVFLEEQLPYCMFM